MKEKMGNGEYSNSSGWQEEGINHVFGSWQPPASNALQIVQGLKNYLESNICSWSILSFSTGMWYHSRLCQSECPSCGDNTDDGHIYISRLPNRQLKEMILQYFVWQFLSLWIAPTTSRWPSKIHGDPVRISFLEYDRQTDLCICGAGPGKIKEAIVPLLVGKALIFLLPWLIRSTNATSFTTRISLVTT